MFTAHLQLTVTLYHAFGLQTDTDEEIEDVIARFKAGEVFPDFLPGTK